MDRDPVEGLVVARIDEGACIGCTLCIAACPVDAIVGAAKLMHTVVAERCTGCELCVPPCPVDCIALLAGERPWTPADAQRARIHAGLRSARLAARSRPAPSAAARDEEQRSQRQAAVAAALARARARRAAARRLASPSA